MNKLRTEAERLRDQGYSYNMISDALGVPKSTMSYWFRDRPFTPNAEVVSRIRCSRMQFSARRHNRKVVEIAKMKKVGIKQVGQLSERDLWILGIGLYIGEGAKSIEAIRISNSDPAVVKLGIKWLKESCGLSDENLSIRLHLYPDNDLETASDYWQEITGLPRSCFRKAYIDIRQNKKRSNHGKLLYGTAHVSVICNRDSNKGVKLYRRLNGWMTGVLGQL